MGRASTFLIAAVLALCCWTAIAAVTNQNTATLNTHAGTNQHTTTHNTQPGTNQHKTGHATQNTATGHATHNHAGTNQHTGTKKHATTNEHALYKDPKQPIEKRVEDLLKRMTLAEKIGQMTQIERKVSTNELLKNYTIGSILSGGGSVPAKHASPQQWIDMVNSFQKSLLSTRLGIPMIYGIDAVHGNNNAYRATIFPHNIGLGATRDPELVRRIGVATALECRATGIPYAFAPCVAVCRDPRWGRCYESYSEDPAVVTSFTEIIHGLQGNKPANTPNGYPYLSGQHRVIACAKHYVGDGGTKYGINENDTIVSRDTLMNIHMVPYHEAIRKGVATVMISYSSWNGVKMHANHDLITNYLKNTMQFKGFVITDWQGIDKITPKPHSNYTYSILASINAGIDMVMVPMNAFEFINGLTKLVNNNFIPMSRINDAVTRILRVKFAMGLFEHPMADYNMAKHLGSKEHRQLAREAVRKSLVLLKNGKQQNTPLLPLPKKANKILVAGTHANDIGEQCGGWTIEWHGTVGNITDGTTILGGIRNTVDRSTHVVYQRVPTKEFVKTHNFNYAIVVVGEPPYSETQGDTKNMTLPQPGPSIINNVCSSVKCVVVLITGRPVLIEKYVPEIDALVAAWLPGSEGQGVADVLFGDYGFTGKLSITWPRTLAQVPMHVGSKHYDPLFPFGFGLHTKAAKRVEHEL